jgi:hypothetical protein
VRHKGVNLTQRNRTDSAISRPSEGVGGQACPILDSSDFQGVSRSINRSADGRLGELPAWSDAGREGRRRRDIAKIEGVFVLRGARRHRPRYSAGSARSERSVRQAFIKDAEQDGGPVAAIGGRPRPGVLR